MFLSKYDIVGKEIQNYFFNVKFLFVPLSIHRVSIGIFEYLVIMIFGIRISMIQTN